MSTGAMYRFAAIGKCVRAKMKNENRSRIRVANLLNRPNRFSMFLQWTSKNCQLKLAQLQIIPGSIDKRYRKWLQMVSFEQDATLLCTLSPSVVFFCFYLHFCLPQLCLVAGWLLDTPQATFIYKRGVVFKKDQIEQNFTKLGVKNKNQCEIMCLYSVERS